MYAWLREAGVNRESRKAEKQADLRTWEGWLYLAVVLDLYSSQVIGWSMKPTLARELALDALLMAIWRRRSKSSVVIHSD